mgnify:FL=1
MVRKSHHSTMRLVTRLIYKSDPKIALQALFSFSNNAFSIVISMLFKYLLMMTWSHYNPMPMWYRYYQVYFHQTMLPGFNIHV